MDKNELKKQIKRLIDEANAVAPSISYFEKYGDYGRVTDEHFDYDSFASWNMDVKALLNMFSDSNSGALADLKKEYVKIKNDSIKWHSKSILVHKIQLLLIGTFAFLDSPLAQIPSPADVDEIETSHMQSVLFWDDIHKNVRKVAKARYEDKQFADAVESAFKCVNNTVKNKVKKKTGKELDGSALMNKAFSVDNPIISLGDLSTVSGRNIQKGYMQIFSGSMTGIRNPKAHDIIEIDDVRARHHIYLASLLLYVFDDSI